MRQCDRPPTVWVQAATAHIYGDPPDAVCDEQSPAGFGLAPFVAKHWEAELQAACPPTIRSVVLRTSFVLGQTGGALPVLRRLARLGLGGTIASGRQWISWLHIDDMVRILRRSIDDPTMSGVYNVTSPHAATNADFMRSLRRAIGIPLGLPTMAWMIRLGAATVFDTDPELAVYGRNVVPKRLLDEGYVFKFPQLDTALADLVTHKPDKSLQHAG